MQPLDNLEPDRRKLMTLALAALGGAATGSMSMHAGAQMPPTTAPLAVGFVVDFEPFVMADQGILVDLAREAVHRLGYTLRKLEFPSLRLDQDPLTEFAAMAMFVGTPQTHRPDYHYTPLYAFDNVAASLTDNQLGIRTLDDLKGKSVVAFNNADVHLKEPFTSFHRQHLQGTKSYQEVERMESIVAMLVNRRAQVVLIDRTFLRFYARKMGRPNLAGITQHELFGQKNIIYAVSKNRALIEAMQQQLKVMDSSGWTAERLRKYL